MSGSSIMMLVTSQRDPPAAASLRSKTSAAVAPGSLLSRQRSNGHLARLKRLCLLALRVLHIVGALCAVFCLRCQRQAPCCCVVVLQTPIVALDLPDIAGLPPPVKVGNVYQRFSSVERGIVENIIEFSIPLLLEQDKGCTFTVEARCVLPVMRWVLLARRWVRLTRCLKGDGMMRTAAAVHVSARPFQRGRVPRAL